MKRLGVVLAVATALLVLYTLRLDDVAGIYVDDAYYIVLARALVNGDGYALTSSATGPILPAFPPGFAILLAPVMALTPQFPANIAALKFISIVAMLGVAAVAYLYMVRYRRAGWIRGATIAVITAVLPSFVFLATSTVMAECVFTLALVGSALAIERASQADSAASRRPVILAAAISTASWLIRSAGLAVIVSGCLYLAWRRGWKSAAGFAAVCALCYLPWAIYAGAHQPTVEERDAHGGSIVYSYRALLSMRQGGDATSGNADGAEVVARVWKNLGYVFTRDLGALIFPAAYRGAEESGQEVFQLSGESGQLSGSMGLGTGVLITSSLLSVVVLIGFAGIVRRRCGIAEALCVVTVAMVVLVPTRTFRYLLPLAPFVVSYFLAGIEAIAVRLRGADVALPAFRSAAACLFVFLMVEHIQYTAQKLNGPPPDWIRDGNEVRAVTDWMNRNLAGSGAVASTNPGLVYLFTGRPAVALVDPLRKWQGWRDSNVSYVVALHMTAKPDAGLGYRLLYESPRLKLWVLDLTAAN